jgi:ArsR family transcriptional regulator
LREVIKTYSALSDETRLRIVNILQERECCVCEIMQTLNISQTRASRNLGILYDAGFLKLKREGLWSVYSIDKEGMSAYQSILLKAVAVALSGNQTARKDLDQLRKSKRLAPKI